MDQYRLKGLKQRAGYTVQFSVPEGPTGVVTDALYWRSKALWLIAADSDLIKCNISGGSSALLFNSATSGGAWAIAISEQATATELALFMPAHASDVPKYYDGSTFANWTQPPQTGTTQTVMTVWKGRVVIGNTAGFPSRLWYGDAFAPLTANYQYITFSDGGGESAREGIRALVVHNDGNLYVFKERSVWQVYDPVTFANRLVCRMGCSGKYGAASHINGRIYFWSSVERCLYSTTGTSGAERESDAIAPNFTTSSTNALVVVNPTGSVLMLFGSNQRIMELFPITDPGQNPIFLHTVPNSTYPVVIGEASATVGRDSVIAFFMGGGTPKAAALFTGTSDDGAAIDSYWTSSWRSFLSEEPLERLRRLHVIYGGKPTIDVYSNSDPTDISSLTPAATYSLTEQSTGRRFSLNRPESRGRYHAVKIRNNTLNKSFTVDKLEFAIRGGKEHATGIGAVV